MLRLVSALAAWTWIASAAPAVDPARLLEGFDAAVESALREYGVPGAAVGVWQDGKVLLAKGYGYRDLAQRQPVNARTVFATGSVTKSVTAAVLATLVDEGKLDWNRPAREYVPWFRMYDPVATELVNVRDMLSHRTGLPRHDFIRYSTYLSREELVRRIRYLEPSHTFRDVYQYNNLMYAAAGYVGETLAGQTWEQMVEQRIFKPLAMTCSSTSVTEVQAGENYAKPHAPGPREIPFYHYQPFGVGPNGALNSCVDDLLKYLRIYLTEGKPVLTAARISELLSPVSVISPVNSYALGWQTGVYRGAFRYEHAGAVAGFRAHAMLLPDQKTAIVALVNAESNLATVLAEQLADRVLGLPPLDRQVPVAAASTAPAVAQQGKPPRALERYAGTYVHPAFGRVRVETAAASTGLRVRFDARSVALRHLDGDKFESPGYGLAEFRVDEKGQAKEMLLPLEPKVKPFVFVRE